MDPPSPAPPRYYFAYGSNLHVSQMARRCPSSRFAAAATLRHYRWQINERGVANVVPSPSSSSSSSSSSRQERKQEVEGVLYVVEPRDEHALDRYEGVTAGCYEKHILAVELRPGRPEARVDVAHLAAALETRQQDQLLGPMTTTDEDAPRSVPALVYLSPAYATDGPIRAEYVARMERAVADAVDLGVSAAYVEKQLLPTIHGPFREEEADY